MKKLIIFSLVFIALITACKRTEENVLPSSFSILQISAGGGRDAFARLSENHTCALLSNGLVKCWGGNTFGQLGLGDRDGRGDDESDMGNNLDFVDLGTGKTAKSIATGGLHSCAILDDDSLKCWGYNFYGQLGLESINHIGDDANEMGDNLPTVNLGTGRTAKAIALGRWHSCAILDNDTVKCWGYNFGGELGQEDNTLRGTFANSMGDNISPIQLGTGRTAKAIASADHHVCVILDDDTVKCWGRNSAGQLGQENTTTLGDTPGEMGNGLTAVALGTGRTAKKIAVGGDESYGHSCAILDNDTVKCWGYNLYGQLGLEDVNDRGEAVGDMGDSLPAISLGTGLTPESIRLGHSHTCIVFSNNLLKCFGNNTNGQLGYEHTNSLGDGGSEMSDNLTAIDLGTNLLASAVSLNRQTCAILTSGRVKCWGSNFTSALGLGDRVDRGDRSGQMGDNLPFVNVGHPPYPDIN